MTATGSLVEADADVAVAGSVDRVPDALSRLAPGGRLVAVAATEEQARRAAADGGLVLSHAEPVGAVVAWCAVLPLSRARR